MSDGKVQGKVHRIEATKTYGQKGFRKRLVVLEQDKGRFVNYIPLEFIQDACDTVDELSVGDDIEVTFRLSGRRWQRDENSEVKFFVNVEAMGFRRTGMAGGGGVGDEEGPPVPDESEAGLDDDVPF